MDTSWVILKKASAYVLELLAKDLPVNILFHNIHHTEQVVSAAIELGHYAGINDYESLVLQTAAWFHDTGYCYMYTDHEDASMAIAGTFLKQQDCSEPFIEQVMACISATRVPQKPNNLLEQIICDADFFHFARSDYWEYADRLKTEWEKNLNKKFSDEEWQQLNIALLTKHRYFTGYADEMWQDRKLRNIALAGK